MIRILGLVAALSVVCIPVQARDGWADGRPRVCAETDKMCQEWIENVKQPDNGISCCATADAYITDDWTIDPKTGQLYAITTVDYPGLPKGTKIAIPPNKINNAALNGGNPSQHSVTFGVVEYNGKEPMVWVYCYFSGTLG